MDASPPTAMPPSSPNRQSWWLGTVSGDRRGALATLARGGLSVLSMAYRAGLAVARLRGLFPGAVRRAPCPVISVGNLTVGGTGKTPMVACLARLATDLGARPLIVSRGYGAAAGLPNEEARELERLCPDVPHVQNPDRLRAIAQWAADHPCDLAILDDGFQHRRLARDLDIVLIDALRPFGYGHLLPRGLLREPPSAIRRADLVVVTRTELVESDAVARVRGDVSRYLRAGVPVLAAQHHPTRLLVADGSQREVEWLSGRNVAAACGIGNPGAFRGTLERLGARPARFDAFPDHHAYEAADLKRLLDAAQAAGLKTLVTTAKDFVKWLPLIEGLRHAPQLDVVAVEIVLRMVEGGDVLRAKVGALLENGLGQRDR